MNYENFIQAIAILSAHHSSQIMINQPINHFVGDLGTKKWSIHIKACVPAVTKKLIQADFMLSMDEYGLNVDKI